MESQNWEEENSEVCCQKVHIPWLGRQRHVDQAALREVQAKVEAVLSQEGEAESTCIHECNPVKNVWQDGHQVLEEEVSFHWWHVCWFSCERQLPSDLQASDSTLRGLIQVMMWCGCVITAVKTVKTSKLVEHDLLQYSHLVSVIVFFFFFLAGSEMILFTHAELTTFWISLTWKFKVVTLAQDVRVQFACVWLYENQWKSGEWSCLHHWLQQ